MTRRSSRVRSSAIADQEPPPRRFIAGADAIGTAERKIADLGSQIEALRGLSTSLSFDEGNSSFLRCDGQVAQ